MRTELKTECSTLPTTRIAWVSRHTLNKEQRKLLQQVYGDNIAIDKYPKHFKTPGECVSFIKSLLDQGAKVYTSPLPEEMERALRASNLPWNFFSGYEVFPGRYQALAIKECSGLSETIVSRAN